MRIEWYSVVHHGTNCEEGCNIEFKTFFGVMKNRISDGYDVPAFFRDLFAMITGVSEEEWGTPKDPSTNKTKDESLRSYAKRTIPKKIAQKIVYRLSKDNYIESLNSRSADTLELLANDFLPYDAEINAGNVADKTADWFVEIIRHSAGLAPKEELASEQHERLVLDLKNKYGAYLLNETGHYCPFPGCGKSLTKSNNGKTYDSYEGSLIDKKKAPEIGNLLALCPNCHATYYLDDSAKSCKELKEVKKSLEIHVNNVAILDPKEIKQKIKPADNFALYNQVNMYVTT